MADFTELQLKKFRLENIELDWEDLRIMASGIHGRSLELAHLINRAGDNKSKAGLKEQFEKEKGHLEDIENNLTLMLYGRLG